MCLNYGKSCWSIVLLILFTSTAFAQSIVTGTVTNEVYEPVGNARVVVTDSGVSVSTNSEGMFSIEVPQGKGLLEIMHDSYGALQVPYTIREEGTKDLGNIMLSGNGVALEGIVVVGKGIVDLEEDRQTPVAVSTIYKEEIQDKAQGNVEFPEVMKNTPSIYVSNQAGGFGDSEMFIRGYDQTNTAFLLNGQPINGMEDGKVYWSNWSGMTEIANAVQIQRGLGSSKLAISSVGGTVNIVTKATEKKQGGYGQFIVGNDSYLKGAIGYNTGLMDNGWGVSIALSHYQSHRKWAEGTRGQGQNYFLSVGKLIGNHNFNFLLTGAPQWHDQNFSKSLDVYAKHNKKYNDNFGFYNNGDYQTLRRNYYHKPIANLNWDWEITPKANLSTVIYASWGRGGGTGGYGTGYRTTKDGYYDWSAIEAYNNTVVAPNQVTEGQVLPDGFSGNNIGYFYYNDYFDIRNPNATGDPNKDRERQRAGLVLRASVNNHSWYGGVSNFNYEINDNLALNVGADLRFYKGDHFREVINFLGLAGYYDNSGPAPRGVVTESFEANPWTALTSYASENQRINYDYSEAINYQGGFGQLEYKNELFSAFFQGAVSNQSYQREDRYNFVTPKESDKINKLGYNLKAGAAFNINDFNTVFGNAGYYSRQPFLDNIFTGNYIDATELITPSIDNEEIIGYELGYKYSTRNLNVNVNLYHTTWDNRSVSSFAENDNGTPNIKSDDFYEQRLARGVKQLHKGGEIDFNSKISSMFKLKGYFSYGDWTYQGTESSEVRNNDTGELISSSKGVDNSGIHISNAPQVSMGMGFVYDLTKSFSLDSDFNYYGRNYKFVQFTSTEENGKLPEYTTLDAGLTYKLKLGSQNIKLRGNVYNVLNNLPVTQTSKYGVYFANGRTWNVSVRYTF